MGFPPPQYNTPLLPDDIAPELPYYPIYGVTPDDKYTPISIDQFGRLNVNATFSGSITIGEIGIADETSFLFGASLEQPVGGVYQDTNPTLSEGTTGAVRLTQYRAFHTNLRTSNGVEITSTTAGPKQALDVNLINNISSGDVDITPFTYGTSLFNPMGAVYQDANPTLAAGNTGALRMTQYRALQVNLRDSSGNEIFPSTEATSLSILADLNQFTFNSSGALIVADETGPVVGFPVNIFADNSTVPSGILTTIVSYTVPASQVFEISGIIGWGSYDGEFIIAVDGVTVGGGWCSPSARTLELEYENATITANAGQVVTVRVTHYSATTEDFKANLLGNLYSTVPNSIWGLPVNEYDDVTSIPPGVETNIITYVVPVSQTLSVLGIYGWGNYDGEFTIRVNGIQVGGGWSSPSDRTLFIDFSAAPVSASAGATVTVNVTQYGTSSYDFQANLLGGLK